MAGGGGGGERHDNRLNRERTRGNCIETKTGRRGQRWMKRRGGGGGEERGAGERG